MLLHVLGQPPDEMSQEQGAWLLVHRKQGQHLTHHNRHSGVAKVKMIHKANNELPQGLAELLNQPGLGLLMRLSIELAAPMISLMEEMIISGSFISTYSILVAEQLLLSDGLLFVTVPSQG
jgi:hypothetical protein